ncbi:MULTISPECIES: GNAT family N-acetyltransferase [Microbacterium]|uniref:GNAT family N-acetyltransferase n=1 Tax=Microbacterium TaxID=33882 RepID=UPI0027869FD7|nr:MULTISPECIES: GNAT family N-acetyltransferase [Microbacterium]MDQ1076042.1 RimJ/RimL family protein N-acetyltransferase [Microbacterium sp. SORGH_AS_0969]MDQ1116281.1 RimJ/RimL family protein N-acetyltransferase [Microbacterium testaceum]
MPLSLTPMDPSRRDRAELIAFLTTNVFPFHVRSRLTAADVERAIEDGAWHGDDTEAYWLDGDRGRVGLIRLDDLGDATAMIDLRLAEVWRGHGFGTTALALARDRVFSTRVNVLRLEGQTREDNLAMRRAFERGGWVCEAYYRDGWPVEGAEPVASVAYCALRRDHVSGSTSPVPNTLTRFRVQDTDALVAAAWAAEERLLDPAVRRVPAEVDRLLDDAFVEVGQSGRRWTKGAIIAALRDEPGEAPGTMTERAARTVAPDTVLLEYVLRFDDRVSRRSSLWIVSPHPRCIFHQGTAVE